jgi:hypothetical protein
MWSLDRRAGATLALIAAASFAGVTTVDAKSENAVQRHESRSSERPQQGVRHEAVTRQSRSTHPARTQGFNATPRQEASYSHQHPSVNNHRDMAGRNLNERHPADARIMGETQFAGGDRVRAASHGFAGGPVHVVRYGNTLSGTVEHTIRPGFTSRTFVSGGHVLYTHVYQRHVWHQYGRAFGYETFVPAVRYPAVYYSWALAVWPRPVIYSWGWQVQPWYPTYGYLFTPYPVYSSPDLWMTDYIIAQSMRTAYQAQPVAPASVPPAEEAPAAPVPDSSVAASAEQPNDEAPAPQPGEAPVVPQSNDQPSVPTTAPPTITPRVKAQLNNQIKVQLREQQAAAAMPAVLTTDSTPPALRPNHVFFQVVQPLDVPSAAPNGHCSLGPNDYIRRTGGMSDEDWKIPVVVELSRPLDCPEGLQTRIGLNDLNAMENEQEARVMEAMQAASKSMGPNGPPSGPGVHPTLIADGSATSDPGALDAIRQAQ